jgi:hypothetical protein
MKALSIRAPWWWFILYGGKDIENRDRRSPAAVEQYIGPVWIHVGKFWKPAEVFDDFCAAEEMQAKSIQQQSEVGLLKDWRALEPFCGCIVGSVEIVGRVTGSASPWFQGEVGLVLRNPVALAAAVPFKGQLGFFNVPPGLIGDAA